MTTSLIDETHDPDRNSWVESANGHAEFPIQNLPFGVFAPDDAAPRPGVAIGEEVFDLAAASAAGLLGGDYAAALHAETLNELLALGPQRRRDLRRRISDLLSDPVARDLAAPFLRGQADVALALPARIGDYTDFYVGIHHATNVGKLFRPDSPLLPNYKHIPIGYHGRASSVRPSGAPVVRPKGQRLPPGAVEPVFGPSVRLDYELELGVWIGQGNALGERINIRAATDHIAGFCLLNDWSARDFQAWEYQPLGPFLAKNFHTTISPWVVTPEALAPFRIPQPTRPEGDPRPMAHLWDDADQAGGALGLELEVALSTVKMRQAGLPPFRLSRGPASNMYWTAAQIVTHHACNGCDLRPGDLLGTGTISAPQSDGYGSLLELTEGGARSITLPNGESRQFLEDGDEVTISARARAEGRVSIGFGACRAVIEPAR